MKKQFVINLVLLQGLNLLVKPLWILGMDRATQNIVPVNDYGMYYTLNSLCLLLFIFLDFGLTNYNSRTISGQPGLLPVYFPAITRVKAALFAGYLALVFLIALLLGYDSHWFALLLLLGINQGFTSYIQYLRSNIGALHNFRTDSLLSVLDKTVMIMICSLFIWGPFREHYTIWHFAGIQTAGLFCCAVVSWLLVNRAAKKPANTQDTAASWKKIFREGYPYALLMALMMAYTRFDGLMLERLHADGATEAARYASGYRLLDAVSMFAALFAGLLLPMFSRMLAEGRDITPLATLGSRLMLIPALAFSAFCVAYRETLMPLMNQKPEVIGDPHIFQVFAVLMCTLVPYCCIYIFGTLVTAKGAIRELNRLAVICLVLNITLNLVLIPYFGARGAAWSTLVTQSLFALGNIWLSRRIVHLPGIKTWLRVLPVPVIIGIAAWQSAAHLHWLIGGPLIFALAVLASFALGIFRPADMLRLLRKEA